MCESGRESLELVSKLSKYLSKKKTKTMKIIVNIACKGIELAATEK